MAGTGGGHRLRRLSELAFLLLSLLLLAAPAVLAKSRIPISDNEIRQKKSECYADVESGLWGWQCKSSMIAKENCALKCLSPTCYEIVYESDPLEEGEKDYTRGQEYKYCMHKTCNGKVENCLICLTIIYMMEDSLLRLLRDERRADQKVITGRES